VSIDRNLVIMADRCPMIDNCLGGVPGHDPLSLCRNGSAGKLCGHCLPGYRREQRRCEQCMSAPTGNTIALHVIVSSLLIFLFAFYLANDPVHQRKSAVGHSSRPLLSRLEAALTVDPKRIAAGTLTWREEIMLRVRRAIQRRRAAVGGRLIKLKRVAGALKIVLAQYQCVGGKSAHCVVERKPGVTAGMLLVLTLACGIHSA
jgi:hypothetical protein